MTNGLELFDLQTDQNLIVEIEDEDGLVNLTFDHIGRTLQVSLTVDDTVLLLDALTNSLNSARRN